MSEPEKKAPVTATIEPVVAEKATAGEVIPMTRAYLSSEHLWTARHLARFAAEREAQHQLPDPDYIRHVRSYAMASVCESVSFLEALINETLEDALQGKIHYLQPLPAVAQANLATWWKQNKDDRRHGIIEKFSAATQIATGSPLDKSVEPCQSVKILIDLRNWMHHYTPDDLGGPNVHKLERKLRTKNIQLNKIFASTDNPWFPDKLLGAGCAEWAIKRSTAFADEFCFTLGIQPHHKAGQYPAY